MADLSMRPKENLLQDLIEEPNKLKNQKIEKSNIQQFILNNIKEIDFNKEANIDNDEKTLKRRHFIVLIILILNEKIDELKLGLTHFQGKVYLFNSEFWTEISDSNCSSFLGEAAKKMGVDILEADYFQFKADLFKQFLSACHWDKKTSSTYTLINLSNGTFEISAFDQILRDFRKEEFLTYQLPFDYDEEATCPLFKKFLNQILPNKELQAIIAEYFGSIFINKKVMKFEQALFLYGSGSNGKSVLFDIINALIGNHNFSSYSLESLTKSEYSRAMIQDKLLNYSSELSSNISIDMFKRLISGEPVGARLPYKNPFMMENYAKLMFNTNELPHKIEHSDAYFRRFLIIPFQVTIKEEDQDRNLAQKIIERELAGVFNWILSGLRRLINNRNFTKSEVVKNQVQSFRREENSVLSFIDEEEYIKSISDVTSLNNLYINYKNYCVANNNFPCSKKQFSKRFEDDGFLKTRMKEGMVFNTVKKV